MNCAGEEEENYEAADFRRDGESERGTRAYPNKDRFLKKIQAGVVGELISS